MLLTELRVDARPLALARVFVAIAYVVCLLEASLVLFEISAGKLAYPVFQAFLRPSSGVVAGFTLVGLVAGLLLLLGLLTRVAAVVSLLVLIVVQMLDQQVYSNHLFLCTLLMTFLALSRCGARWSLDAWLRGGRELVPWWPQLLMMTQVCVCYLFAGVSKINPMFISGETLPGVLWLDAPNGVFRILAGATICTEVFLAVCLWAPRLRLLAVLVGVVLHVSIMVMFDGGWITFLAFGLLCASTYWMFLDRPTLTLRRLSGPVVYKEDGLDSIARHVEHAEVAPSTDRPL